MTEPIHRVAALPATEETEGGTERPGLADVVQAIQDGRDAVRRW
ncbi:hypothetical protein [Nocardia sp. NPDC050406]